MRIINQYNNLISISDDFRAFVEKMDKYSTDEIIALYDLKNDIISYCSGPLGMQASTQAVSADQHQDF